MGHQILTAVFSFLVISANYSLAGNIKFAKALPDDQVKAMTNDLNILSNFKFTSSADQETLNVMELRDLNSASAETWLYDRVAYITEPFNFNEFKDKVKVRQDKYIYQNQNIKTPRETPTSKPTGKGVVVMSNMGAFFYGFGKQYKSLLGLDIETKNNEIERVSFTSPRTGLIAVGPGLFLERLRWNKEVPEAESNSLMRLTVFFHEARHSDGNGKSLSFQHAVCPDGHDFQGYNACDRNLNGPYNVGALIAKEFFKNCTECNDVEKEKIKMDILNSKNRLIKVTETIADPVTDDEQLLSLKLRLEIRMLEMAPTEEAKNTSITKITQLKKEILELAIVNNRLLNVASKFLDASPEGTR